jgi:hypothetical protein
MTERPDCPISLRFKGLRVPFGSVPRTTENNVYATSGASNLVAIRSLVLREES